MAPQACKVWHRVQIAFGCVTMPTHQEDLRNAWLGGQDGRLRGREQAKAWALREAWNLQTESPYGMLQFVCGHVRTNKNGEPKGDHPQHGSMSEFFAKVDADPDWFPGKTSGAKRGPARVLKGGKKSAIVQAAKKLKREGTDITYPEIVAAAPSAILNPETGEPVDKKLVYRLFREDCHGDDPEDRWDNRPRLSRTALEPLQVQKRLAFGKYMQTLGYTDAWYFKNLAWCDICNSILPRTQSKANQQKTARKGKKYWGSKAEQQYSHNLRGSKRVLKMRSSDTVRVWFVPILARGKLHIEVLPDDFPGDVEEGMAAFVARVRAGLNARFPDGGPKQLFTDRGNGFYGSGSGAMTDSYRAALKANKLNAFMGTSASMQPGCLQEVMLHETAMAWVRIRLAKTVPKNCWTESVADYHKRLKACCADINATHNVDGLCRELPLRVQMLVDNKGDCIPK